MLYFTLPQNFLLQIYDRTTIALFDFDDKILHLHAYSLHISHSPINMQNFRNSFMSSILLHRYRECIIKIMRPEHHFSGRTFLEIKYKLEFRLKLTLLPHLLSERFSCCSRCFLFLLQQLISDEKHAYAKRIYYFCCEDPFHATVFQPVCRDAQV